MEVRRERGRGISEEEMGCVRGREGSTGGEGQDREGVMCDVHP